MAILTFIRYASLVAFMS